MSAFLGMRGTGDWVTNQRPKNYRELILYLYPNGMAPLTAILSKIKSESTDDPEFNWWTKNLASQGGTVSGIYTDAAMNDALAASQSTAAGTTLFAKVALSVAQEIRPGHVVILRDASHYDVDVVAKVTGVLQNGASSRVDCKLLEADDNGASTDLSNCDTILIIGNLNPEGGVIPDAVSYDPTKYSNYTQIFRTPLDITRTARKTKLRTGDQYKESKREALELHSIEMEKELIWGIKTENTGDNGKPERTTQGLISMIRENASSNVDSYALNSSYSGQTWLQGGEDWFETYLEQVFRYGSQEKLALCGSGALLGLQKLAKTYGNIQLKPGTGSYGIKVTEWITPFGVLQLKTHPLFSYETTNRNSMVIVDVPMLVYRYIDDTFFKPDKREREAGYNAVDGTKEEFLTEMGLEYHHPLAFMYLNGVGLDNSV